MIFDISSKQVEAGCWHELMSAGVTHLDSWRRIIQRWFRWEQILGQLRVHGAWRKKILEVTCKLVAGVTADDKFTPFLVDANAQLLHPRTCACTYICHLLVLVSEPVPWLAVWNISVHGVFVIFHFCWSSHLITYEHLSLAQKFWYHRS